MKKILSFLIVLGALTFINIDLFASSIYGAPGYNYYDNLTLDTPLDELNGDSLKILFESYNLVLNGNVDNDINNWSVYLGNLIYENDGKLTHQSSFIDTQHILYQQINNGTSTYYFRTDFHQVNNLGYGVPRISLNNGVTYYNLLNTLDVQTISFKEYVNVSTLAFYTRFSSVGTKLKIDNVYLIDLEYNGLDNLTLGQLDYFYTLYTLLKNGLDPQLIYDIGYIHGYDDGNLQGYNDGYDEGLFDYHTGNYYGQYDYTLSEPYNQATQANISLLSVFSLIIGVVMSMLGFIINIEMFGISIASILGTLAIGVSIIWLLKLIRG